MNQLPPGMLLRLIESKQCNIVLLDILKQWTKEEQDAKIINDILNDENKHLEVFVDLYSNLYGQLPDLAVVEKPVVVSFAQGLQDALMAKFIAYGYYGNIFLTDGNAKVRDIFQRALFDENIHSTKLTFIYSKALQAL